MGGIDIKYILIGGVLVLLLVLFGNNPIENAKNEKEKSRKGKDPLMLSIQEHLEKDNKFGGSATAGSGSSPIKLSTPSEAAKVAPPPASSQTGRFNGYNNSYSGAYPRTGQPSGSQQGLTNPDRGSYYPPAPEKKPSSRPDGTVLPGQRSDTINRLRDGRVISYYGAMVFTTGRNGEQVLLPDGKYLLSDSNVPIVIRDGVKVRVVN